MNQYQNSLSLGYWEWQEHDWHHVTNPNQLISLASYKGWM
jgi:hypothetical protein